MRRNLRQEWSRMMALAVMFFVALTQANAQVEVKGTVADESGETVIGASVVVKGQAGLGTVTDFDGNFRLKLPSDNVTLVVSFVGMKPQEIKVGRQRTFKIVLHDDKQVLQDVVVVGYGQQKKASVVGAITQTDGKVLERTGGVSSLGAALTGNLPGVITMSSTGMPGEEDPQIVIRGISSWNNSEPLVLVDGIERPMSAVDISSVQSVSVLKDASATAVYGVKGANGVILITTKRGADGKARIEVGLNAVAKVVSKLPGKLDSYGSLYVRNQAIEHELGLTPDSWSKIMPADILNKYRNPANIEEAERYANVDWEDELFKKVAFSYNPHVNISGGTKNVKYFAAIDFLHEGDLFKEFDNGRGYEGGFGYNRINIRSNMDFQITKTTLLKANIFGSSGQRKGPYNVETNEWGMTQFWQAAYSAPSDAFLPRYSDGSWGYYPQDEIGAPNSAYLIATSGYEHRNTTRVNTDFTLEQDLGFLLKGLKASATVSWDNVFVERRRGIQDGNEAQRKWVNPETGDVILKKANNGNTNFDFQEGIKWNPASGEVDNGMTQRNLFYQAQLFWGNKFGEHDITAMGVFNRTERAAGGEFTHYREDWAFRATYAYGGRYFFEYNGAYNGSEKFSSDNRFAFFNSGAIGWLVSEEKWWKPLRWWVPMLKFRYSYGEVGDDNVGDRWLYVTQWAYGGTITQGLRSENNPSPYVWYKESRVGNEDVHWERAVKQNLGIDYSFLDGILAGSLDFFWENRKDILVAGGSRAVPSYYGTTAPTANLGRVKTHGYELELRVNKKLGKDWRLWGNFNMTHAENVIKEYDDAALLPAYQKTEDYSIGQNRSYQTNGWANTWDQVIGVTQYNTNDNQKLPGMYQTIDFNGDGVIDANDSAPYQYTGTPQNTYSATIGFDWKGLSVMCQFYGVTNVSRYVAFNSLGGNLNLVYDEGTYWTKDAQDADAPMPRWNSTPNYYEGVRFLYDGSFVRLKTAEIAYTWNADSWIKHIGLSSLKLFVNGNNLWSWSRMPDDRESNFAGTGWASQGAYPTVKRFNFGLKFTL